MSRQSPLTVAAPLLLSTIVSHAAHHRENGPSKKEHDPVRYEGREESIDASEPEWRILHTGATTSHRLRLHDDYQRHCAQVF